MKWVGVQILGNSSVFFIVIKVNILCTVPVLGMYVLGK